MTGHRPFGAYKFDFPALFDLKRCLRAPRRAHGLYLGGFCKLFGWFGTSASLGRVLDRSLFSLMELVGCSRTYVYAFHSASLQLLNNGIV